MKTISSTSLVSPARIKIGIGIRNGTAVGVVEPMRGKTSMQVGLGVGVSSTKEREEVETGLTTV